MYGGRGPGKFYCMEVRRIEDNASADLPKSGYTPEQIEAGFDKLAKAFGFYSTLLFMESSTPYKRDELLKWTVNEFKFNLKYLAWKSHMDNKLAEIMKRKK